MVLKLNYIFIVFLIFRCACCASVDKSNVAFVIDDTASMGPVINQVKLKVKEMFETIYQSKETLVGDFILVTFNDIQEHNSYFKLFNNFNLKANRLLTKTRDANTFLTHLENIEVDGGGDCPELSLRGIYRAIEECNQDSYIYVFTDASARDYHLQNTIEHLAQSKSIRIIFLVAHDFHCGKFNTAVYKSISSATNGQMFEINNSDIGKIINYITHCQQAPQGTVSTGELKPGKNDVTIPADKDMKNLTVVSSVPSGSQVNMSIYAPDGTLAPVITLIDLLNIQGLVVENPEEGNYTVKMDSDSPGSFDAKAVVSIDFNYRFSTGYTNSMADAETEPVRDKQTYLLIQLVLRGTNDAKVKNITITDLNGKELISIPADIVNEKEKLYISTQFKSPTDSFNIAIKAVDLKTNELYIRKSQTPIKPRQRQADSSQYKRPEVTIKNSPELDVKYEDSIILKCKVNAYPKPNIVWEDEETGSVLSSTVSILKLPYEYESELKIDSVTKDGTYVCKAISSRKEIITASIKIKTIREHFIKVLELPKDIEIDYKKSDKLQCKIDGWPPIRVGWYKNDKELTNDGDFEISADNVTLLIKEMRPELEGLYYCRVSNDDDTMTFDFNLILPKSIPEIDQSKSTETILRGTKATISCRIIKGVPEPEISWSFWGDESQNFLNIPETGQELQIASANLKNAGVYRCVAKNIAGEDTHETRLIVEYPPVLRKFENTLNVVIGANALLSCRILEGIPKPTFTWEFKRRRATEFVSLLETERIISVGPVNLDDSGVYKCYAKNKLGEDSHKITLSVQYQPTVIVNRPIIKEKVGKNVVLKCDVTGEPYPDVTWMKDGTSIAAVKKYKFFRDHSVRFSASLDDRGNYTCIAKNDIGNDSKNVTVHVYDPIKIEPPKQTPVYVDVGETLRLLCKASGVPKPSISWMFIHPNMKPEVFRNNKEIFQIRRVQENKAGHYRCIAQNEYDNADITFEVFINVPVHIEHPEETEFNIVPHDLLLKIPCKVKGFPKPKIVWTKIYTVLEMGDTYTTEPDGTLIIKNPNEQTIGKYLCVADNGKTHDMQLFEVMFTPIPIQGEPSEVIRLEEGATKEIDCILPHQPTDTIRWYTNGRLIPLATNEFILRKVTQSDSGIYSCRVMSTLGSQTAHIRINVGAKPVFDYKKDSENIIPFILGRDSFLDCFVRGTPAPTITWWHNGTQLQNTSPLLHIKDIDETKLGEHRCEAKNEFGTITRSYVIKITGCPINYNEKTLNKFHPIISSRKGVLEAYPNENGVMTVPYSEPIRIVCPNNERYFYCNTDNLFIEEDNTKPLESRSARYVDLQCDNEVKPIRMELHKDACASDSESRFVRFGYETKSSFCAIYEACVNRRTDTLYYIKHGINKYASDIKIGNHPFIGQKYNYDEMFDCSKQNHAGIGCCFLGRQLVSPEDVAPGVQKSTYFNINVSPVWNFCGNDVNMNEIDRRIRHLAKSTRYKLEVFIGEHGVQDEFQLNDRHGNQRNVPKYLWKVISIPDIDEALAVIIINVPLLLPQDADKLIFCTDICDSTDWMNNLGWRNASIGFTFCCDPWDFANAIDAHYQHIFPQYILTGKNIK